MEVAPGAVSRGRHVAADDQVRGGLQVTLLIAQYLLAWALGYVLGYKLRQIRSVLQAA